MIYRDLDSILYCSTCGSTRVETKMWVNPNTFEISSGCSDNLKIDDNWCKSCTEHTELMTLRQLWNAFAELPVNNNDEIEHEFLNFPAGTSKFEVWHWFDERCPNNLHDDLMYEEEI